jgi:hypothetical protein
MVWAIAIGAPLAAAALMVPFRTHTQASNLALIMVVVVSLTVLPGRRAAAFVAGLSAGLWFDFFLTRPFERFTINRSQDLQTTLLLAGVAVIVGEIAVRRGRAQEESSLARNEVTSLYVIAQMLSAGTPSTDIVEAVAQEIREVLFLDSCRFDRDVEARHEPLLGRDGELDYGRLNWNVEVDGLPNRDVTLPVEVRGRRVGRFVLRGPGLGVPLSLDRRLTALALADLAGSAVASEQPLASPSVN